MLMSKLHSRGGRFPCTEPQLYDALCSFRSEGCKVGRLQSIIERVTFCRCVFNLEELQDSVESRRCRGVPRSNPVSKPCQATPLTVCDLVKLHRLLLDSGDSWDVCFIGAVLFCVYSRSRWPDFQRGKTFELHNQDRVELISLQVAEHKTMHASAFRFCYLELTAPADGVVDSKRIEPCMAAREKLGAGRHHPPMPAPSVEGNATMRPLDTSECGTWLRLLLGLDSDLSKSERRATSHSLKATMLSFAAKRGLSHHDRLVLGHH